MWKTEMSGNSTPHSPETFTNYFVPQQANITISTGITVLTY